MQATFEFISALRPSVHAAMAKLAQRRPSAAAESLSLLADYMEDYHMTSQRSVDTRAGSVDTQGGKASVNVSVQQVR